jgi:hypothetical protein
MTSSWSVSHTSTRVWRQILTMPPYHSYSSLLCVVSLLNFAVRSVFAAKAQARMIQAMRLVILLVTALWYSIT